MPDIRSCPAWPATPYITTSRKHFCSQPIKSCCATAVTRGENPRLVGLRSFQEMRINLKASSLFVLFFCACAVAEDYPVGDQPFRRYVTKGREGQPITFYLSIQPTPSRPLPLIVWIQGTGCSSQFVSEGGRMS